MTDGRKLSGRVELDTPGVSSLNATSFPLPKIKVEVVQPQDVDSDGDLTLDYRDWIGNKYSYGILPEQNQWTNSLTSSCVTGDHSKSKLPFPVKRGVPDLNNYSPSIEGRHVCISCNKCFMDGDTLKEHVFRDCCKELQCSHCSFRTEFTDDMQSHMMLKHKDSTDVNFFVYKKDPDHMGAPIGSIGVIEPFFCTGCGKSFKSNYYLKRHIKCCEKSNTEIVKYKCAICLYETKWKNHVRRHLKMMHPLNRRSSNGRSKCHKNKNKLKQSTTYVRPKDDDGDLTLDYRDWIGNNKLQTYGISPQHQQDHELTSGDVTDEKINDEPDIDSKSELASLVKQGFPQMNNRQHLIQGRHVCISCNKCFMDGDTLKEHVFRDCCKELQCSHCSFRTEFTDDMQSHMMLKHKDSTDVNFFVYKEEHPSLATEAIEFHQCTGCGKSYKNKYYLKRHMKCCEKSNDEIVKYKCFHCLYETKWKNLLRRHLKRMHFPNPRICPGCGKCYKTKNRLMLHRTHCRKSNGEILKYKCSICLYETKWKDSLKRHTRDMHSIEVTDRPVCTACGKSFKRKDSLNPHMRYCEKLNTEIVKYKCSICLYETKWKSQLTRHFKQEHSVEAKDRPMCTGCGKCYKNKVTLRVHRTYCEKANTQILKHKCSVCFFETKWKKNLKEHIARVHPVGATDRPVCPACGKSLKNESGLKHHTKFCEKSNNEVVKHKCSICFYETKWKSQLTRHIRQEHSEAAIDLICTACGKYCKSEEMLKEHLRICEKIDRIINS